MERELEEILKNKKDGEIIGNKCVLMGCVIESQPLKINKPKEEYILNDLTEVQKEELLKQIAEQIQNNMKNAIYGDNVTDNLKRIADNLDKQD